MPCAIAGYQYIEVATKSPVHTRNRERLVPATFEKLGEFDPDDNDNTELVEDLAGGEASHLCLVEWKHKMKGFGCEYE